MPILYVIIFIPQKSVKNQNFFYVYMFPNLGYSHDFLIFSYDFIHLLGIDKHYH